jgi:RNA polymerase sigma-70 factor (ECF subfamily)
MPAEGPDFAAIFRSEFSYVWNTLARLGIRAVDLEDASHELFCHVHRKLPTYDASRPLRPWLFGFAFRLAADYRRLSRHRLELTGLEVERADPAPSTIDQLISAEERALIETALTLVPLERRAVLILHEIDGTPVPVIAAALSLPLNTTYSRLRLARADLASAVKRLQSKGNFHGPR